MRRRKRRARRRQRTLPKKRDKPDRPAVCEMAQKVMADNLLQKEGISAFLKKREPRRNC